MASVRVALKREAQRLAEPATASAGAADEVCVPGEAVQRLYALVQTCEQPERTLRWAWQSLRRTHSVSGRYVDGLAAIYLLATLLHIRKVDRGRMTAVHA